MADRKISELTNITGANLANADEFVVVDTSADETKAITFDELKNALDTGTGFVRITGDTMTGTLRVNGESTMIGVDSGSPRMGMVKKSGYYPVFAIGDTNTDFLFVGMNQTYVNSNIGTATFTNKFMIGADADVTFYNSSGSGKAKWTGSQLGIGTTSPSEVLTVASSTRPRISITDTTNSKASMDSLIEFDGTDGRGGYIAHTSGDLKIVNDLSGEDLLLGTVGTERVRLDSSGNLGIGTSSPSSFYSGARNLVVGSGTGEEGITIYGGDASTSYLLFADGTSGSALYAGQVRYNHTNNRMEFATSNNSAARLVIDSSGRVGIGTSAPIAKLDVRGYIYVNEDGSDTKQLYLRSDFNTNGPAIQVATDHPLVFTTNNTEKVRITSAGYVGIGTTAPSTQLEVKGSSFSIIRVNAANTNNAGIDFGDPDDNDIGRIRYDNSTNSMAFTVNAAERMRITNGGNVGINETAPHSGLHVKGSGSASWITIENTLAGNYAIVDYLNDSGNRVAYVGTYNNDNALYLYGAQDGPMQFFTNSSEKMRITSDGKVGIGTTSPKTILDLGSSSGQKIMLWSSNNIKYGISIETSEFRLFAEDQAVMTFGGMSRTDGTTFDEHMRITSGGDVGIGFSSPTERLVVDGSINSASQSSNFNTGPYRVMMDIISSTKVARIGTIQGTNTPSGDQGTVTFYVNNSEKMRLATNGRLGIGETSPTYGVHVSNQSTSQSATGTMYIGAALNGSGKGLVIDSNTRASNEASTLNLQTVSRDGQTGLGVTVGGKVGIGTANPSVHLDLGGTRAIGFGSRSAIFYLTVTATSDSSGNISFELGNLFNGDDSIFEVLCHIVGTSTYELSYVKFIGAKVSGQGTQNTYNILAQYSAEGATFTATHYDVGGTNSHGTKVTATGMDASSSYTLKAIIQRIGESTN